MQLQRTLIRRRVRASAAPVVLRMAVDQVGIVPFDAERLQRPHILRERSRAGQRVSSIERHAIAASSVVHIGVREMAFTTGC
jgi:hypothetical protein